MDFNIILKIKIIKIRAHGGTAALFAFHPIVSALGRLAVGDQCVYHKYGNQNGGQNQDADQHIFHIDKLFYNYP